MPGRTVLFHACLGLMLLLPGTGAAGEPSPERGILDELEDEANGEDEPDRSRRRGREDDDETVDDAFLDLLLEAGRLLFQGVYHAGHGSYVRIEGCADPAMRLHYPRRRLGEPTIPLLAVDAAYREVSSDVDAGEFRLEAGYGPLGVEVRHLRFREDRPDDGLSLTRLLAIYRMSLSRSVELDVGVGSTAMTGDRSTTGLTLATPLIVDLGAGLSLEARPSWAWLGGSTLGDHSLGLAVGRSIVSVRAGYAWVSAGRATLSGPVLGVSVRL